MKAVRPRPAKFQRFDESRLRELMSWFPDAGSLRTWGGPESRDLYRRLGFSETPYPEPAPEIAQFIYMVRPAG